MLCFYQKKKGYKEIFGDDNCFFNLWWRVQVYIYAYAQTHQIKYTNYTSVKLFKKRKRSIVKTNNKQTNLKVMEEEKEN